MFFFNKQKIKQITKGGAIATFGYILSPLSFWNDLFVNVPLAFIFAWPFSLLHKSFFVPMFILGYWITNVLGFLCMHYGVRGAINGKSAFTKKDILTNVIFSILYTGLVVLFIQQGWLQIPDGIL